MPQMVAIFNGFGGGASVLVAGAAFLIAGTKAGTGAGLTCRPLVSSAPLRPDRRGDLLGLLIAFGKLSGDHARAADHLPGQKVFNALMALGAVACRRAR